jgi:hypothetical protein
MRRHFSPFRFDLAQRAERNGLVYILRERGEKRCRSCCMSRHRSLVCKRIFWTKFSMESVTKEPHLSRRAAVLETLVIFQLITQPWMVRSGE